MNTFSARRDTAVDPQQLKALLSSGLMSFPITDFDEAGDLNLRNYRQRLEWLMPYGASVLFAGGGTGEGFSMTPDEHVEVIGAAVETCAGDTPIIAGVGYSTRLAIEMARNAEAAGAAGILLLPHYLTEAGQAGLKAHIDAVCKAVRIGVVVYNRNVCRLSAVTMEALCESNSNLIGFKDGIGDIEAVTVMRHRLGDRVCYLGGLPTAEVYAEAYNAAGFPVYSSAVFNFIPKTAMQFYQAVREGDQETTGKLLKDFFLPYIDIRNGMPGYAVSIVKAGARLVGHPAGPVRPPLVDLNDSEHAALSQLIDVLGPQ